MSFVLDQIRRIDAQLDRLQLASLPQSATPSSPTLARVSSSSSHHHAHSKPSSRVLALQAAVRGLSPGSSDSRALLRPKEVEAALSTLSARSTVGSTIVEGEASQASIEEHVKSSRDEYEHELEWLLVSKATTQVYGHVLSRLLDETVALAEEVYYWDAVLTSRPGTALYGVQISPARLWAWTSVVWEDVKTRREEGFHVDGVRRDAMQTVGQQWKQFYGLVRQVVSERNVTAVRQQVLSPVTRLRSEIRQKQASLKKVRLRHANALGVLLGEGLANESVHGEGLISANGVAVSDAQQKFKTSVARNVALMEAVLAKVNDVKTPINQFDAAIGELTEDDPLYAHVYDEQSSIQPDAVAERLTRVLALGLPQYAETTKAIVREHGRPSRMARYWLPVTIGILSSSTVLRILVNRKAEIVQWIRDFGTTVIDFWTNWVIEPTRKVIQTIRHDAGSEVSIMSKRSLEGDRASLERMVVDFAIANPATSTGDPSNVPLTDSQIADLRLKIREGDLTPVLRAYEKDLASPFLGAVRGNLIRALLIQIQKTKVDVEVAIGGIDSLLKSQELVFGFVGLTPGILVSYAALRSLRSSSLFSAAGSPARSARRHGKVVRTLRNIDRLLTHAVPTPDGELLYKDQGLMLCEVHVLRQAVQPLMPRELYREFGEDAEELCDVRLGVERQRKAAERIRWAYARWLK